MQKRWTGVVHALLIIMSFGMPWVYPEDYGNTVSVFGMHLTTGSDLQRFGDVMGFLMTGGIMVAGAAYLWLRWSGTQGAKTAITLFALVVLYPVHSQRLFGESLAGIPHHPAAVRAYSVPHVRRLGPTEEPGPRGRIQSIPRNIHNWINAQLGRSSRKCSTTLKYETCVPQGPGPPVTRR